MQALVVVPGHVAGNIDAAVPFEIAAVMMKPAHQVLFLLDRFEIDHGQIAAGAEAAVFIENIGDAPRHAGGEVAAGGPDDDDETAGHIFAAVIARALHHRDGAGIAHREAFPGNAAEISLAGNGAVQHGIARDDGVFRREPGPFGGAHDEAAAREALADIIVGVTD